VKCITDAWDKYERELRGFLHSRVRNPDLAEDLLQDVFLKALAENNRFCTLDNTRAWLFRVTRNRLIDYYRTRHIHEEVPDQLADEQPVEAPVVHLSQCLPSALEQLSAKDREVIEHCDLDGMSQAEYAQRKGLTLAGAKSRIQRARKRLREALRESCNIIFDEQGKVCCFNNDCEHPC
jgi:RNA polymerase sigma-70 factor (ECF subfamily)